MRRGIIACLVALIVIPLMFLVSLGTMLMVFEKQAQACSPSGGVSVQPAGFTPNNIKGFDSAQLKNASTIGGVGKSRAFSQRDIMIALMVAIQESRLRNLTYGDRDSLGLFQQRPSQGWGSPSQILDPVYASNKFYDALAKVSGRDSMSILDVALAVQRPSRAAYLSSNNYFPGWEDEARALMAGQFGGGTPPLGTTSQTVAADLSCNFTSSGAVEAAVQFALSQVGKPYIWGGQSEANGFDCSGLMHWAYGKAGVTIPRVSRDQYKQGAKVDRADLQRGDLVYWAFNASTPGVVSHVAMYLGNNQIVEAPSPGKFVHVATMHWNHYVGATRPVTAVHAAASGNWRIPITVGSKTSPFGMRYHPVLHVWKLHDGQDWGTQGRTPPVYAAASGTVTSVGFQRGYGNAVVIDHGVVDGKQVSTLYAHLSSFAPGIRPGVRVQAGQPVGNVGSTGYSTGEHLHFTVRENSKPVDPIVFLRGQGVKA